MTGTADVKTGLILWRWLRRHPVPALLALLPFVLIYALALLTALLTRAVFDAATTATTATTMTRDTPHGPGLATLVTLLTVAHLASVAIGYGELLAQATSRHLLAGTLRYNLFAALLRRPGARALTAPVGEVVNRFRDDPAAVQALLVPICNVCSLGLFSAAALGIMLSISVSVTLGVCLPLLAVALIAGTAGPRAGRYYAATRAASGRVSAALGELFGAVAAIKVAGAEERVLAQLRPLDAARRRVALRERVFVEVADSIYGDIATLGTGVVLLFAMQSMRAGTFTVGDLTLFTTFLGYTSTLTGSGGVLLGRWRTAGVALGRLAALLPETTQDILAGPAPLALPIAGRRRVPPSPPDPAPAPAPAAVPPLAVLTVSDLTYRHPESGRGIESVDLRLVRGTFTVVTGPVGSGKTTLLLTLLGLLPRERGEIRWNGRPVSDPATFFVPPRSAFTPQVPRLFSDPLRENILLGLPASEADLQQAIWRAAMERDVAALERGLETPVGPRGVRLSGGQAQRAAAARMLVRSPELLVVDDLSSALDVETEATLWRRLFARPDTTVLAVSHRRAALQRADQIIVLEDGGIAASGKLDEHLLSCEALQRLWSDL